MEYLVAGARGLLGLVFLVSVVGKVAGRHAFTAFAESVRSFGMLPPGLVRPAARTVTAGEAAVCVLMTVPARGATAAGFALAAVLLAAFTAAIAAAVRRGATAPCRCFGPSTTPLGTPHLVRNLALCAVAVSGAGALAVPVAAGARPGGAVVAGAAGLIAGIVVTQLDHLMALFRPLPAAPAADAAAAPVRRHRNAG
ncbi:methylamine utilization protein MauE [Streptomyces sp. BR123]|uniref:MauE/DoxX family redox-associated membrane protein n=1 Tax=Streptomyces sp. BR123 TaxID=2749828 RepID=UPI0015C4D21C|nr:MauE/DoxX family redox-associated membrane protein [Streptomyces sp. BR123]NXY96427.1 methylamine utilization protein MauE [Streptomyces sp. BR123]